MINTHNINPANYKDAAIYSSCNQATSGKELYDQMSETGFNVTYSGPELSAPSIIYPWQGGVDGYTSHDLTHAYSEPFLNSAPGFEFNDSTTNLTIIGQANNFYRVLTSSGQIGWIPKNMMIITDPSYGMGINAMQKPSETNPAYGYMNNGGMYGKSVQALDNWEVSYGFPTGTKVKIIGEDQGFLEFEAANGQIGWEVSQNITETNFPGEPITLYEANVVNCNEVYIRSTPEESNANIVDQVKAGTTLKVIGMSQNYYKVYYNGIIGYVNSEYLSQVIKDRTSYQINYKVGGAPQSQEQEVYSVGKDFEGEVTYNTNTPVNGQTVAQEEETSPAIANMAHEICKDKTTNVEKAKAIYQWIAQNITYDNNLENEQKAGQLSQSQFAEQSTAVYTFNNRTGICEGFSALYNDMCRAVGLEVRTVTGYTNGGLNSNKWGGHAWNQVYLPSLGGWINVDCTLASDAYTPVSEGGAGMPKSDLNYIFNPNTITEIQLSSKTVYIDGQPYTETSDKTWGNLDYFNNPEHFNTTHRGGTIQTQGFAAVIPNSETITISKPRIIVKKIKDTFNKIVSNK